MPKYLITILMIGLVHGLHAQVKSVTYTNSLNAYYSDTTSKKFYPLEPTINKITLNSDATYEMLSQPSIGCLTWREYHGRWDKHGDTILLKDSYVVYEKDNKLSFSKDNRDEYYIRLLVKGRRLSNTRIKVGYVYDFDSKLKDIDTVGLLNNRNEIAISFKDVPNRDKLASIRITYNFNNEKRDVFLTTGEVPNIRHGDIPNMIEAELIENPKKEIIYRTVKAIIKNNTISAISISKTTTQLHDYFDELKFADNYTLVK